MIQYKRYRYDLRTAYETGYKEHPQDVMKNLGYNCTYFEGCPIGDCVFMEFDKDVIKILPFLDGVIVIDETFYTEKKND